MKGAAQTEMEALKAASREPCGHSGEHWLEKVVGMESPVWTQGPREDEQEMGVEPGDWTCLGHGAWLAHFTWLSQKEEEEDKKEEKGEAAGRIWGCTHLSEQLEDF
jgi:hypothetical protein